MPDNTSDFDEIQETDIKSHNPGPQLSSSLPSLPYLSLSCSPPHVFAPLPPLFLASPSPNPANARSQVVSATAYLHSQKIVHRDIKPENILYKTRSPHSEVVLADFGIAKHIEADEELISVAGSFGYAAPEVLMGVGHGVKVDCWSIGLVLLPLLPRGHLERCSALAFSSGDLGILGDYIALTFMYTELCTLPDTNRLSGNG